MIEKDPISEGRKLNVFDPTGKTASITIDDPEASVLHLKTLQGIFVKYKNALAITKRMTGPI